MHEPNWKEDTCSDNTNLLKFRSEYEQSTKFFAKKRIWTWNHGFKWTRTYDIVKKTLWPSWKSSATEMYNKCDLEIIFGAIATRIVPHISQVSILCRSFRPILFLVQFLHTLAEQQVFVIRHEENLVLSH